MGKKINYRVLENKITRDWANKGKVKIIDMPRGFFAVHFENEDDYKHALFEGPWMVADHYLLVQRWRPNFLKRARRESKVAVWVRIPELPLELYNQKFLTRLGGALGGYLKMDRQTQFQHRGQYARICVEVDLAKPLVPFVEVRGEKLNLEYEGLHSVCFNCGICGHRKDSCNVKTLVTQAEGGEEKSKGEVVQVPNTSVGDDVPGCSKPMHMAMDMQDVRGHNDGSSWEEVQDTGVGQINFGPWMLSKKEAKRRNGASFVPKGTKSPARKVTMGLVEVGKSRFDILNEQEECAKVDVEDGQSEPISESEDEELKKLASSGPPGPAKVRNANGGRNARLGPRIHDVKKAARSSGNLKKTLKSVNNLGPLGNDFLVTGPKAVYDRVNKGDFFNSTRAQLGKGKEKFLNSLKSISGAGGESFQPSPSIPVAVSASLTDEAIQGVEVGPNQNNT